MNTDKNGWPYLVIIFAIFASIGGLMASTDNLAIRWFGCIAFLWFWSCVGLFLNLVFSKQLKPVPIYKKLFFAFFPLMYMSQEWRDWFHQEINAQK